MNFYRTVYNSQIEVVKCQSSSPPQVRSWMSDKSSNLGLLVTVKTLAGSQMDDKVLRFASGRDHHHSKQPMLVLFTDDGRRTASPEINIKGMSGFFVCVVALLYIKIEG